MAFLIPEFVVEDKNLPKVLKALAGLVVNLKAPRPVVNAEVKNGKIKQIHSITQGSPMVSLVADRIRTKQLTEITPPQLRELIVEAGGQDGSYSYFIRRLQELKVLKKSKTKGGPYPVTEPKE